MVGVGIALREEFSSSKSLYLKFPLKNRKIDYIQEVHPNSPNSMKPIVIATEYLTMWTEAKAFKTNDTKQFAKFFYKQIITRFGCPKILIINRSKHFLYEVREVFKLTIEKLPLITLKSMDIQKESTKLWLIFLGKQ